MENRNYKFDNIKALLIFFVVLCHFFELFEGNIRYRIYMFIYSFHMPLFVFVSGYFARGGIKKVLCKQVYTYVIFQVLFCFLFSEHIRFSMPYWHLWYLFCLIIWTLSVPLIKRYTIFGILISLTVSLLIGFININMNAFSFYRLVSFFPFFVIGNYCGNRKYFQNSSVKKVVVGLIVTTVCCIYTYDLLQRVNTNWLFRSMPYNETGCNILNAVEITLCASAWIAGVMLIIPGFKIPIITDTGKYSICIFLLHGFVQRVMYYGFNIFVLDEWENIFIAIGISLIICVLFGNKYIYKLLRPFTDCEYVLSEIDVLVKKNK